MTLYGVEVCRIVLLRQRKTNPPVLTPAGVDELLSMTLIANLATIEDDGDVHLFPMWFLRIENNICVPTSHPTHKY